MKIAIVSPGYLPVPAVMGGAVEALITFIINENENANHPIDITLYTVFHKSLKGVRLKHTNIHQIKRNLFQRVMYHILYKIDKSRNYYYERIIKKLRNTDYDFVIVENNIDLLINLLSKSINKNNKLIYHFHNDIETLEYTSEKFKVIKENRIPVITVSEYVKRHLNNLIPEIETSVLPNVIDLDRFRPELYDNMEIRAKYGIRHDDIVFMYIGRIVEYKGVLELVRSFVRVVNDGYSNIRLLIVGSFNNHNGEDDTYTKKVKEAAKEVSNRIIFTGFVPYDEIPKYYVASSVVVVVTWMEAAGLFNIEARAMGKALITSNVGGIPEYTNEACILVDRDDSFEDNIVAALKKVLDTPGLIDKMQNDCKVGIEEYCTRKYYQNFIRLIEDYTRLA